MKEELLRSDRIFVAGHNGLIGSAVVEKLVQSGYRNIVTKTRQELDLLDQRKVDEFYLQTKPDVVFDCAAKVGGIHANNTFRADFIYENLQIQNNIIWGAHKANVRKLIFLGSSCIYPKNALQPIKESYVLTGELETTNRPYAIAKIAGLELVNTLRTQYGRNYFSAMPTNLYGPKDNFHAENSHVIPGLIRRFVEAERNSSPSVAIWGNGEPLREFMYSEDCASAILHLAETVGANYFERFGPFISHINIGTGDEISIKDLAILIKETVGYKGAIEFDASKPNGTMRKVLDSSLLRKTFQPSVKISEGIGMSVAWYKSLPRQNTEN